MTSHLSTAPVTGAAPTGSGAHASGMCPSPASRPRGRVKPDPAGARQINFGPGVQVGEIGDRPGWAVERLHIRL